jgi:hypothetical protein
MGCNKSKEEWEKHVVDSIHMSTRTTRNKIESKCKNLVVVFVGGSITTTNFG